MKTIARKKSRREPQSGGGAESLLFDAGLEFRLLKQEGEMSQNGRRRRKKGTRYTGKKNNTRYITHET